MATDSYIRYYANPLNSFGSLASTLLHQKCASLRSEQPSKGTSLKKHVPENFASDNAIDILSKMLAFDPDKRWTVQQLLKHPYLAGMQCDEDEPVSRGIPRKAFEFEQGFCTPNMLREEIIAEMLCYDNEYDSYHRPRGGGYMGEQNSNNSSRSLSGELKESDEEEYFQRNSEVKGEERDVGMPLKAGEEGGGGGRTREVPNSERKTSKDLSEKMRKLLPEFKYSGSEKSDNSPSNSSSEGGVFGMDDR